MKDPGNTQEALTIKTWEAQETVRKHSWERPEKPRKHSETLTLKTWKHLENTQDNLNLSERNSGVGASYQEFFIRKLFCMITTEKMRWFDKYLALLI